MARRFDFVCPVCEEATVVDRTVRNEMLAEGCVYCSADVRTDCFEPSDESGR